MAYAITQSCCADASCVSACPVNCIHPAPGEPAFGTTDQLFIDPVSCIDCGACADACPVDAAQPADQLTGSLAAYIERNRDYFSDASPGDAPPDITAPDDAAPHGFQAPSLPRIPRSLPASAGPLRIAVVGTGPSAGYTVQSLLRSTDADITLIDRHPAPGGLIRYGVAPDHPATKRIGDSFARAFRHPRVSMHLGTEVGRDLSHADILDCHHAVVYATGADTPRDLGIDGEDLPGSIAATDFLFWSNGRPGSQLDATALDAERAVVVGNGNVALDVARLLLSPPGRLAATGIAAGALDALRA
ncbi:MAG: FAD-dependent oxidoreductase, partial [Nocardiopsaceae bacterium]|nr:FAD-dependent oxidoreductase [Nocardiopsaceae bacterium]